MDRMKKRLMDHIPHLVTGRQVFSILLAVALPAFGQAKNSDGMTTNIPGELPDTHLVSPVANGQWTMPAGDYGNTRYSPLSQINTTNVQNLHVVGTISTGIPHGHEGAPLVVGSTLYIVTPFPDNLIAVDLTKPGLPTKWVFSPNPDITSVGIACCDVVNRGAAYADDKIIYNTLDANTVAVDANTGKLAWRTQVGDIHLGETITGAPLVVNNIVFVGDSGGELGVRGKLTALDAHTGKILWRAYSSGQILTCGSGRTSSPSMRKIRAKTWE
jgi:lanthanide-dependent methanol dehydrogenase